MAVLKPVEEQKAEYRSIIATLIDDASEKIKAGEIAIQGVEDLEKLIELDMLFIGEPTNIAKDRSIVELSRELRELLDAKIEELRSKTS